MTTDRHLERDLPAILGDIAVGRYPEYIDDVLSTTAQRRQRPAWTFPERWLPVELVEPRAPVARLPWRQLGVLAILTVLLAAAVAVYIGSRSQRLPPAFGPAANGSLVFAKDGDIYTADPRTGTSRVIVAGPETDSKPVYSLDGTRLVFGRMTSSGTTKGLLFVSREDGTGAIQVTPEPLFGLGEWSFSPDGRSIVAFAAGDAGFSIAVIPSDGSGQPKFFPVFATTDDGPPQYRPDGSEIMFIGKEPDRTSRGVYALNPTTGEVRLIIQPPSSALDIHGASWSPDGKHVAYGMHDMSSEALTTRTHVVNADGTGDVAIDIKADSVADAGFRWSNDGTRLIVARYYTGDGRVGRSAILPIDRSSVGVELECPPVATTTDCTADWTWSPDDSQLLGTLDLGNGTTAQYLADPLTGLVRAAPWSTTEHPDWQRLAR